MADAGKVKVTICGGGNGAHTLAGISSMNDQLSVTVLDIIESEQQKWEAALASKGFVVKVTGRDEMKQLPGEVKFKVTRDVPEAIATANVVIIIAPAFAHETYFELIMPHLPNGAIVAGMPGRPGFEYQCLHFLKKCAKKCAVMSFGTLPWACRINDYGHEVMVLGVKDEIQASLITQGETTVEPISTLQTILGKTPVITKVAHNLELCLMAQWTIHPPIMYARWKDWNGEELESPPLFYQGVDKRAVECIEGACDELRSVSEKLKEKYPEFGGVITSTMHTWMVDHYSDQITDKSTLMTVLKTNKAYDGLTHPMTKTSSDKYVPNFKYRYLTEDIPFSLLIPRSVAEMLGVKTPIVDEIITWAQDLMGTDFLVDGKINGNCKEKTRAPQRYGLRTIEDLLEFCKSK